MKSRRLCPSSMSDLQVTLTSLHSLQSLEIHLILSLRASSTTIWIRLARQAGERGQSRDAVKSPLYPEKRKSQGPRIGGDGGRSAAGSVEGVDVVLRLLPVLPPSAHSLG